MRFSSAFLDDLRSRFALSDVVGRKVTWDARKSVPGKGDFWAPCPFHQEKTPSFHVDDRKGFYHCFGCQASGDLFKFVMEAENLGFGEAVERLATEAGVDLPARDDNPRAAEQREQRDRLGETMEEAVRFYRGMLNAAAGQGARDYVRSRGLADETLKRFEIGYAPEGGALAKHLAAKGLTKEGIEAGLLIEPDEESRGGRRRDPFDRFRDRLMFPIRDQRGRAIAFGGRALSANAQAKYLNSPETPLFSKGRTLFNIREGRAAAGKAGAVIVAEGYMDVIALVAAGFEHAVAPLGTAVTEEQLALLWRMADEPVIALDGDAAGLRAANRLVDLALPHLAPAKSLRFCLMPEGRDPDDMIRHEGPAGMAAALEASVPLVEMLWRREVAQGPVDTPERRAGFDQRLRTCLSRIGDASVRSHYAAALKERRAAFFRPPPRSTRDGGAGRPFAQRSGGGFGGGFGGRGGARRGRGDGRFPVAYGPAPGPTPEAQTMRAALARDGRGAALAREAAILCSIWECAGLLEPAAAAIEDMEVTSAELQTLHAAALNRVVGIETDLDEALFAEAAKLAGARPFSFLARLSGVMARSGRPQPGECRQIVLDAMSYHRAELAREAEQRATSRTEAQDVAEPLDLESAEKLSEEDQAAFARKYGAGIAQLRAVIEERDRLAERLGGGGDDGDSSSEEFRRVIEELDLPPKKP
ncbi:MAG: DNA primase [Pseudomonadota bacterium]